LRKYCIQNKLWVLFALFSGIFVLTIVVNVFLNLSKVSFFKHTEKYFTQPITSGDIVYLFPDILLLGDVVLSDAQCPDQAPMVTVPIAAARISLLSSLRQKRWAVSGVVFYMPRGEYQRLRDFLLVDLPRLIAAGEKICAKDAYFSVRGARLNLGGENARAWADVLVDFTLARKGERCTLSGQIAAEGYRESFFLDKAGFSGEARNAIPDFIDGMIKAVERETRR